MPNPFAAKFNSQCQNCGQIVPKGIAMYAAAGLFICETCADEGGFVCKCGNFKKEDYDLCYTCSMAKREKDAEPKEEPEWDPWATGPEQEKIRAGYKKVSVKVASKDGDNPVKEVWKPPF